MMKTPEPKSPTSFNLSSALRLPEGPGGSELIAGNGVVQLIGRVVSETDRQVIEEWIRRAGPHLYFDEVDVAGTSAENEAEDTRTAAIAGAALIPHLSLSEDYVRLRVSNGWVELNGEVMDFTLRETLDQIVRELKGVTGLTNCLGVQSEVSVAQLKHQVAGALERIPRIAGSLP